MSDYAALIRPTDLLGINDEGHVLVLFLPWFAAGTGWRGGATCLVPQLSTASGFGRRLRRFFRSPVQGS